MVFMMITPEVGSVWTRLKGQEYTVEFIADIDSIPCTVVYKTSSGKLRTLPLDKWNRAYRQLRSAESA